MGQVIGAALGNLLTVENFIFVNISFSVPRFHFFRSSPGFRHQKNAILITIPAMSRRFIFCPQILLYDFSLKNILRLR